jgi:hypothetical protein
MINFRQLSVYSGMAVKPKNTIRKNKASNLLENFVERKESGQYSYFIWFIYFSYTIIRILYLKL